jgi:hypothetical protein
LLPSLLALGTCRPSPIPPLENWLHEVCTRAVPVREVGLCASFARVGEVALLTINAVEPWSTVVRLCTWTRLAHPWLGDSWPEREAVRHRVVFEPNRRLLAKDSGE